MPYCQSCNRIVVIGKTYDGKVVPLDPKASVYRVVDKEPLIVERATAAMVAHVATCPSLVKTPWKKEIDRTGGKADE